MTEGNATGLPIGLCWKDKETHLERTALPFQTVEVINESRATREREKGTFLRGIPETSWHNRLMWGDNRYIMASLLDELAGKIDLIYIDPPFATGADFSVKMELGDAEWQKEPSAIEDKAYRDTWGKGLDSYLQMMYERLLLMKDLLTPGGSIYVHLDWRLVHYIKVLSDEVFGFESFLNDIIWKRAAILGRKATSGQYGRVTDTILFYSNGQTPKFNRPYIEREVDTSSFTWDSVEKKYFKTSPRGDYSDASIAELERQNRIHHTKTGGIRIKYFLEQNTEGKWIERMPSDCLWLDIPDMMHIPAEEKTGFATQKPEPLLRRVIEASSDTGDIVADFFCGSGTTGAVAEKLGRRWIMADLSRYAIHVTRKRLLGIDQCKPFVVQNLGRYERQYWQGITFKQRSNEQIPIYEYIEFILNLYHAEPISGMMHIHGKKGKRLVHVGAVDAPVTLSEIKETIAEVKKAGQDSLDILGWEWEMGLHDVVEREAKAEGVHLRLFSIPRDVMDPRAVEKGDITFYELAYLEVETAYDKHNRQFFVELKDFAIPNLDLVPQEIRDKIKKWSDYIDYWAVDWDWNQDTFHNTWQSYRTRKDRALQLKTDGHTYDAKGDHLIMVKVIDIFGNDTTRVVEVKS